MVFRASFAAARATPSLEWPALRLLPRTAYPCRGPSRLHAAASTASVPPFHTPPALADMLVARELTKPFPSGDRMITVLRDVGFTIPDGEFIAIVGASGSG